MGMQLIGPANIVREPALAADQGCIFDARNRLTDDLVYVLRQFGPLQP